MSGSHAYGGDCPGMAGAYHYGGGGRGILGALVVAAGFYGASIAHPADDANEYYGLITSIPAGLTIDVGEAGDFDASALDGSYVVPWDLYDADAGLLGSTTFTIAFGTGALVNLAVANLSSGATLATAAVTVGGSPGVRNLAVANLASVATLSTASVSVPTVRNLAIASLTSAATITTSRVSLGGLAVIPMSRMLKVAAQNRIARF